MWICVLEITQFPALLPHSTALTTSDVKNDAGHQSNRWRRPRNPDSSEATLLLAMCTDYWKRLAKPTLHYTWLWTLEQVADQTTDRSWCTGKDDRAWMFNANNAWWIAWLQVFYSLCNHRLRSMSNFRLTSLSNIQMHPGKGSLLNFEHDIHIQSEVCTFVWVTVYWFKWTLDTIAVACSKQAPHMYSSQAAFVHILALLRFFANSSFFTYS